MDYAFHPAVANWLSQQFDRPTNAQALGWPAIQAGRHTLIAAPTGSGKTLAAFLAALDRLFRAASTADPDEKPVTKVLYISPLKALSNDIHYNLETPLAGIRQQFEAMGMPVPAVKAAVRTGDTKPSARQAMIRKPPHILVTTPESCYLLLTSKSGRNMLRHVETVIVDEIHALAGNRRGAHLALSLERLAHLTGHPLQRIGLSATQRPIWRVARFLVGGKHCDEHGRPDCVVVDEGHVKQWDLALVLPDSPLEAVMSHEVWEELYSRLCDLIGNHQTTLIFVNTRRLAERLTYHLADRLGKDAVSSHHGSLALQQRQSTEHRLKAGQLRAVVATASLELGIDIGDVALVCQIGSPRSIAAFLQRVGRASHHHGGVPKGRLFPLSRDEHVECAALLMAAQKGELDHIRCQRKPLDVLSQQIVAACSQETWQATALFDCLRAADPYRTLTRKDFDSVVYMLADGITTKRGRKGAHIYYDGVNQRIRGRKGAQLTALTCGGAIPDNADYQVVLEPAGTVIGSINEDFAIESIPGDIFQLGNHGWRILKIEPGKVRVEDAAGLPPTIPFWFGEAPGRTDALSKAVSDLRQLVAAALPNQTLAEQRLQTEIGLPVESAHQLVTYLAAVQNALGVMPTQTDLVVERFFDESGGMQLVLHSPYGSRLNRAWGLALRKRFCRAFNFELQGAATEDAIVLSLGPKHAFPLDEMFRYLHESSVARILVQALLDAPMFQIYWRWNASRSLALVRQRGGKRVPPQIQRMLAEDLVAVVFPDQLACLENIAGDREIPDHPLVNQTIDDCLHEAMDLGGLRRLLSAMGAGDIRCHARDLPEPSPLSHEALNANPYAFLDDAPLEERRTQAVHLRRSLDPAGVRPDALLSETAMAQVRQQTWPTARDTDEVHEALLLLGGLPLDQVDDQLEAQVWPEGLTSLSEQRRAGIFSAYPSPHSYWIAAERLPLWQAMWPQGTVVPPLVPPARDAAVEWDAASARVAFLRGWLECCGPTTEADLCALFNWSADETEAALLALEVEGMVLRGKFDPQLHGRQWCNRRLLARIHHLTVQSLRARVQAVSAHCYMRFLFHWQHLLPDTQVRGPDGLAGLLQQMEGFEAAAETWEKAILPARIKDYREASLDQLCLAGKVGWGRLQPPRSAKRHAYASGPLKSTPIGFFPREHAAIWCQGSASLALSGYAQAVFDVLCERGALFFAELQTAAGILHTQAERGLGELVAKGLVTCDSFAGLRALLVPTAKRPLPSRRSRTRGIQPQSIAYAGRWSLLPQQPESMTDDQRDDQLEHIAWALLRRWGVVFRKLLDREPNLPRWGELLPALRRLEAIGNIRGGHFVARFSGEQFALPEAVGTLRDFRDRTIDKTITLNACDPLNLTANLLPGATIPQTPSTEIPYQDGLPKRDED